MLSKTPLKPTAVKTIQVSPEGTSASCYSLSEKKRNTMLLFVYVTKMHLTSEKVLNKTALTAIH